MSSLSRLVINEKPQGQIDYPFNIIFSRALLNYTKFFAIRAIIAEIDVLVKF